MSPKGKTMAVTQMFKSEGSLNGLATETIQSWKLSFHRLQIYVSEAKFNWDYVVYCFRLIGVL